MWLSYPFLSSTDVNVEGAISRQSEEPWTLAMPLTALAAIRDTTPVANANSRTPADMRDATRVCLQQRLVHCVCVLVRIVWIWLRCACKTQL